MPEKIPNQKSSANSDYETIIDLNEKLRAEQEKLAEVQAKLKATKKDLDKQKLQLQIQEHKDNIAAITGELQRKKTALQASDYDSTTGKAIDEVKKSLEELATKEKGDIPEFGKIVGKITASKGLLEAAYKMGEQLSKTLKGKAQILLVDSLDPWNSYSNAYSQVMIGLNNYQKAFQEGTHAIEMLQFEAEELQKSLQPKKKTKDEETTRGPIPLSPESFSPQSINTGMITDLFALAVSGINSIESLITPDLKVSSFEPGDTDLFAVKTQLAKALKTNSGIRVYLDELALALKDINRHQLFIKLQALYDHQDSLDNSLRELEGTLQKLEKHPKAKELLLAFNKLKERLFEEQIGVVPKFTAWFQQIQTQSEEDERSVLDKALLKDKLLSNGITHLLYLKAAEAGSEGIYTKFRFTAPKLDVISGATLSYFLMNLEGEIVAADATVSEKGLSFKPRSAKGAPKLSSFKLFRK